MIKRQQEGRRLVQDQPCRGRNETVAGCGRGAGFGLKAFCRNAATSSNWQEQNLILLRKIPFSSFLYTFTLTYSCFVKNVVSPVTKGRIWT